MFKKIIICLELLVVINITLSQNFALRFFGNGQGDIDRVKIPIDNPHKNADVGYSFTIEFQMKANIADNPLGYIANQGENDDWTLGHVIIDRDIFGAGDYGDYGISLVNGKIAFGVNNGFNSYTIISEAFVADGNWHYIALTRDSNYGLLQVFVDGILDKSVVTNVTGDISYRNDREHTWPNDPYIVLGAEKHDYDNSNYPSFNGILDELRISNIIRYSSDYNPQIVLSDDEFTMALYHFDEGTGNILYDNALLYGNSSNGIIMYGGDPYGPVWVLNDMQQAESVQISVLVNPPFSGIVTGSGDYLVGEEVNLMATPEEGFLFYNWTENDFEISSNPILSFIAQNNRIITANFQESSTTYIINNDLQNPFSIIHNPIIDFIIIKSQKTELNPIFVEIYSSEGKLQDKLIIYPDYSEFLLDISELKSGIYILKILQKDKVFNYKIVKN